MHGSYLLLIYSQINDIYPNNKCYIYCCIYYVFIHVFLSIVFLLYLLNIYIYIYLFINILKWIFMGLDLLSFIQYMYYKIYWGKILF